MFDKMKFLRKFFLIFLVLTLFLLNIGITVNRHYCSIEGISSSVFIKPNHSCKLKKEVKPACCSNENENNCCHDETEYHQVKLDFSNSLYSFTLPHFIVSHSSAIWSCNKIDFKPIKILTEYPQPPPKIGKQILIQKQVLRL